jgi:membrane protein YqaA with SNARE-associated domain
MVHLTDTQKDEAKYDLVLADIALKQEQLRAMKAFENWRFVLQVATAGAAIGGAFGVWLGILLR